MNGIRAFTVCVEYHDILEKTLPINAKLFDDILVITAPQDFQTIEVCARLGVKVFVTDEFWKHGAQFNKYAAVEQGLNHFGRSGWMCALDADVVFSGRTDRFNPQIGRFYVPRRRQLDDIRADVPEERKWARLPYTDQRMIWSGYCQIFHADDPHCQVVPWFDTHWKTAACADTFFGDRWPERNKFIPGFEVLHIGQPKVNWCGRVTPFADGTVPQDAEKRAGNLQAYMNFRKGKRSFDKYDAERIFRG